MQSASTSPGPLSSAVDGGIRTVLRHDRPASLVVFLVAVPLSLGIAVASSATSSRTAAATSSRASGSRAGNAAISQALRAGLSTTGPVPGTMSSPTPAACSGTMMSLSRIGCR